MSDLNGRVFRSYEILRELGRGGMAVVYLARQQTMDRLVAVKIISQVYSEDPDFRARFDQEARTIARLEHPHILPVIDYGEEDFGAYLVMRFVDGGTLERRLLDGPLRLSTARDMLARIASALDYAHGKGVVHRDLKPANILLDEVDNPYLTDFGIAKILQSSQHLTRTGAAVGTPAYMAPEQWKAEEIGPATDQYSLGVMLYQMVTGDLPFKADTTFGFMHKHVYEVPDPPRMVLHDLPPAAEQVILRALAKTADGRYPSIRVMSDAFTEALAGGITPPAPVEAVAPTGGLTDEITFQAVAYAPSFEDELEAAAPPDAGVPARPPVEPARQGLTTLDDAEEEAPPARGAGGRGMIVIAAVVTVGLLILAALATGGFGLLGGGAAPTMTPSPPLVVALQATDAPAATAGALPEESDTATPEPSATDLPAPTITPDVSATADAAQFATLQQVVRDLTATANMALLEQATRQVIETETAQAVASFTATPSPTVTPSPTMTPSPTVTPSLTPTVTRTPSATHTPSLTPTRTPTPTWTPLALVTLRPQVTLPPRPTQTPRPSSTPTAKPLESCPDLLPSRLAPGDMGQVSDDDPRPVNVRRDPGLDATRIDSFTINTQFRVLEGPVCESGYAWFRVARVSDNSTGWVAESGQGVYYLEPVTLNPVGGCPGVLPPRLATGMAAVVDTPNGLPLRLHHDPGATTPVSALIANRMRLTVEDGAVCLDGFSWWKVRTADNRVGWISEADADSYFVAPAN